AEDGIRGFHVTGVQTCALPISQIAKHYGLSIDVHNEHVDATFRFMCLDKDGKIRMDCSSPYAMASLVNLSDQYDIAFGNDPDYRSEERRVGKEGGSGWWRYHAG